MNILHAVRDYIQRKKPAQGWFFAIGYLFNLPLSALDSLNVTERDSAILIRVCCFGCVPSRDWRVFGVKTPKFVMLTSWPSSKAFSIKSKHKSSAFLASFLERWPSSATIWTKSLLLNFFTIKNSLLINLNLLMWFSIFHYIANIAKIKRIFLRII